MGESGVAASPDGGDSSEPSHSKPRPGSTDTSKDENPIFTGSSEVIQVVENGDIVLDLVFETSASTLRKERKAELAAARKAGSIETKPPTSLKSVVKRAYRADLASLKKHSKFFANLLTNPGFSECRAVDAAHTKLKSRGSKPSESNPHDLPWIVIKDDDEATQSAGREAAFEDMLRIIHQLPIKTTKINMTFVTNLAVLSDRFDCATVVSRALNLDIKLKWPMTSNKPLRGDHGQPTDAEKVLRQKILVSYLLGQPNRLHQSTREIIMRGSCCWPSVGQDLDGDYAAAWWNLPDGLEHELENRRECILNTIASVQRHFLALYTSRERQCKLAYDSSAACDSFQLGQMLKFLSSKNLLFMVDFSQASLNALPSTATLDVDEIINALKQCPNYQIDKFHTNCGLRIRMDPILDYIRAVLSANAISVSYSDWRKQAAEVSWVRVQHEQPGGYDRHNQEEQSDSFAFTRAIANDQRLRHEGTFYAERMARRLFTAGEWDWTPEA